MQPLKTKIDQECRYIFYDCEATTNFQAVPDLMRFTHEVLIFFQIFMIIILIGEFGLGICDLHKMHQCGKMESTA